MIEDFADVDFATSSRSRTPSRLALWLPSVGFFLAACALTLAFHNPLLVQDGWEIVPFWDAAQRGALKPSDFFISHNGHWIVVTRLLLIGIGQLTAMSHLAEAIANLVACGLAGWALVAMLTRAAGGIEMQSRLPLILGLAAFFIFSLDQAPNLLWGWQIAVFLNLLGALTTIWLLARDALSWPRVAAAGAAAVLCVYDFATGFAILPIGFFLICCAPRTPKLHRALFLGFWALLSAALVTQYVLQVVNTGQLATSSEGLANLNLPTLAIYVLTYIGGAIGRFSDGLAVPLAVIGLGVAAFALTRLLRTEAGREAVLGPLALILYALGGGLITALARVSFGIDQALVSRYISFSNLFWIGALALAVLAGSTLRSKLAKRSLTTFIVLVVLLKVGNVANVVIDKDVPGDHARMVQAARQLREDYLANRNSTAIAVVAAPTQPVPRWLPILHRDGASIFRDRPE